MLEYVNVHFSFRHTSANNNSPYIMLHAFIMLHVDKGTSSKYIEGKITQASYPEASSSETNTKPTLPSMKNYHSFINI